MRYEDAKALCYRINALFNAHDLEGLVALCAPGYLWHLPGAPGGTVDVEGFKQSMAMFFDAFPDWHNELQEVVVEGDTAVARLLFTGTHLREFQGIPPTGKMVTFVNIDLAHYADGMVKEEWSEFDQLGMMQQLGVAPPPAAA